MNRLAKSPTIRTQICLPANLHGKIINALKKRAKIAGGKPNFSLWIREYGERFVRKYS